MVEESILGVLEAVQVVDMIVNRVLSGRTYVSIEKVQIGNL